MILPIGHQESEVRRLPWVTFAIIAICLGALLVTDPGSSEEVPIRHQAMEEAVQYWRDHVYLEARPEILIEVSDDVMPNERTQYVALLRDQGMSRKPFDAITLRVEQAKLDRLSAAALGEIPGAVEPTSPYQKWGLTPALPTLTTFVTHMFMHAGWIHLLGNMFMLFLAAPAVEDRWGRPMFAAFFVLAGVFSGGFFALMSADSSIPLVGASGAIAAVLGAFLVRFAMTKIRFFYFFFLGFRFLSGTFEAAAWIMLPLWFASELFQAWLMGSLGGGGIAYYAHVGGFIFGVGAALAIRVAKVEENVIHPAIEGKVTLATGNEAAHKAMALKEAGELDAAYALLEKELRENPADPDLAIGFWDAAVALQRPEGAVPQMTRLIENSVAEGHVELAARYWEEMTSLVAGALVPAPSMIKIAASLRKQEQASSATSALRDALDDRNTGLTAALALRILQDTKEQHPDLAARAAQRALESRDMHEAKRARLRAELEELEARADRQSRFDKGVDARDPELSQSDGSRAIEIEPEPAVPGDAPTLVVSATAPEAFEPEPAVPEDAPTLVASATAPEPFEPVRELSSGGELVAGSDVDLDALPPLARFSDAKVAEVKPLALEADALRVALPGDKLGRVAFAKMQGIAVGAVSGLAQKPVLLVDLLLNWSDLDGGVLRVVRLRSDRFDPRALVPEAPSAIEAFRQFLAELLEKSGAAPLPDSDGARGSPFRTYADLATYQRDVLEIE